MDMKSLIEKMDQLSQVDEAKPDFLDIDKDGDKKEPMKKAAKEKDDDKEDKEKVDEAIAIQADGQEAMALLDILKLSGQAPMQPQDATCGCGSNTMQGPGIEMSVEAEDDPSYTNSPDEVVHDMDAATPSGNDMHKEKDQYKHSYHQGDNPMAMEEIAKIEGKLAKMFESLSQEFSKKSE